MFTLYRLYLGDLYIHMFKCPLHFCLNILFFLLHFLHLGSILVFILLQSYRSVEDNLKI